MLQYIIYYLKRTLYIMDRLSHSIYHLKLPTQIVKSVNALFNSIYPLHQFSIDRSSLFRWNRISSKLTKHLPRRFEQSSDWDRVRGLNLDLRGILPERSLQTAHTCAALHVDNNNNEKVDNVAGAETTCGNKISLDFNSDWMLRS